MLGGILRRLRVADRAAVLRLDGVLRVVELQYPPHAWLGTMIAWRTDILLRVQNTGYTAAAL